MKHALLAASAALLLGTAVSACSQPYGPGMMGGYGGYGYGYGLNLSDEQRSKIAAIQREDYEKRWKLMDKMHEEGGPMDLMWGPYDEKAARKAYQQMAEAQKEMFELNLQTRKRIDAVLTPEQREQMQRGWRGRR